MRQTSDAYALFKKHAEVFTVSDNFTTFIQLAGLNHLDKYIGGWAEDAFNTFKAGKETYKPLRMANASKFSDLFTAAYFLSIKQKNKPENARFLSGSAGLCKWIGGTRGWSKTCKGTRSRYGSKFYGTYVVPIERFKFSATHFEAIKRTDGILITIENDSYINCNWLALLDLDANIEDMFDEQTKALLAAERQADIDAWGNGDPRQSKSEE